MPTWGEKSIYETYFKRLLDVLLSFLALLILSPLLFILTIVGSVTMRGNPFFLQKRPGKNEQIFTLFKFRTMLYLYDETGKFLPDNERLNKYGRILRATSLDELPSLVNILIGDLSFIGPRPLSLKYIPYYTEIEHHRHDVRPGLTGLAQVNGRNNLSWEEKFEYDLEYIQNITFANDVNIFFTTVKKVIVREGIGQGNEAPVSLHILRKDKLLEDCTEEIL